MACFLVPTGETVVVKAVEKAAEKREQNAGISEPAARFAQFLRETAGQVTWHRQTSEKTAFGKQTSEKSDSEKPCRKDHHAAGDGNREEIAANPGHDKPCKERKEPG